jgi:nitrate reductase (cytochrome), electron transfer subunit
MRSARPFRFVSLACVAVAGIATIASSQSGPTGLRSNLRGNTPLQQEGPAPRLLPQANSDIREVRNYPEQPPVIPHTIEGYQVDLNGNKCLSCHARSRTGESQAPMISITHFMDRDGQFLATISPRRFFCTACHVPQHEAKAPVPNDFVDIDTLLARSAPGGVRR